MATDVFYSHSLSLFLSLSRSLSSLSLFLSLSLSLSLSISLPPFLTQHIHRKKRQHTLHQIRILLIPIRCVLYDVLSPYCRADDCNLGKKEDEYEVWKVLASHRRLSFKAPDFSNTIFLQNLEFRMPVFLGRPIPLQLLSPSNDHRKLQKSDFTTPVFMHCSI